MATEAAPKLVLPDDTRFACESCGDCCRNWPVPVTESDLARIRSVDWQSLATDPELGISRQVPLGLGRVVEVLRQGPDRRCLFLGDDNLCRLHAKHGGAIKPVVCQVFPIQFLDLAGEGDSETRVGLQFNCLGAASGAGPPLSEQRAELASLRKLLREQWPSSPAPETAELDDGLSYASRRLAIVLDRLADELQSPDLALRDRLLVITEVTGLLAKSRFPSLEPGKRDLVAEFIKGTRSQVERGVITPPTGSAGLPERLLFRQLLAYRTLDHAPELTGRDPIGRTSTGLQRLIHALRWTFGFGTIRFRDAETVSLRRTRAEAPTLTLSDEVLAAPLSRYLAGHLRGARPLSEALRPHGAMAALGLLLRQVPMVILLARAACLLRGGRAISEADVLRGIRAADLSFGQFLLVGGPFNRSRQNLLRKLDGVWRHLTWCGVRAA